MTDETPAFDPTLFPDAQEAAEAEGVWGQGKTEAERENPAGTFQVEIAEATLGSSQSSGRLQITYKLRILAGDSKDVEVRKYDGLGTPQQAKITQQQLKRLGVNTDGLTLAQLPAALLDLVGKKAIVLCKQNGQYYNIFFQRLIQVDGEGGFEGAGAPAF